MNARQTVLTFLALTALAGLLSSALPPQQAPMAEAAWLILTAVVPYVWFYKDSAERGFARTSAWSAGIILLSIVAVPLYLFKSRRPGQRLKAVAMAFGVLGLSILLPAVGAALYELPVTGF